MTEVCTGQNGSSSRFSSEVVWISSSPSNRFCPRSVAGESTRKSSSEDGDNLRL